MTKTPCLFALLLCLALAATPGAATAGQSEKDSSPGETDRLALPDELRRALNEEMTYLQKGMMSLIPAIATAEWTQVGETAGRIRDSYIMKKRLTAEQKRTLHRKLPALFKEWDHVFHRRAGEMARAARQGDAQLVVFYFNELTQACVECHSRYAAGRFTGFKAKAGNDRP